MPAEPNLTSAAQNAYTNMALGATTQADWLAFCNAVLPSFPDAATNNHPIANWLALLSALATGVGPLPATPSVFDVQNAVSYVFRLCLLANYLSTLPAPLITVAQANVILAAYNAHL